MTHDTYMKILKGLDAMKPAEDAARQRARRWRRNSERFMGETEAPPTKENSLTKIGAGVDKLILEQQEQAARHASQERQRKNRFLLERIAELESRLSH